MKSNVASCLFVTMVCMTGTIRAQNPVITSFSPDGMLVCTNLNPGSVATVAWASSLLGPWQTNWALNAVTAGTEGTIQVSVPILIAPTFYRVLGVPRQTVPAGMVLIPAGSFTMGDTLDADGNAIPVDVYVSAFYMDTNKVSFSQWQTVYTYATNNGYSMLNGGGGPAAAAGRGTNYPVYSVDWYQAVKWCNARSEQEGKTPLYYTDPEFTTVYRTGETPPYVNWRGNGYRLPTEAEWEKAARGGFAGRRFPWGDTISESQANYAANTNQFAYDLGPDGYNTIWRINATTPGTSQVGAFPTEWLWVV